VAAVGPGQLSDSALSSIRALATDLPAVWSAPSTTPADRQRVARLLLDRVVVTVDKGSERVDVALHWVGGAVRSHTLTRPVKAYARHSDYPHLVDRVRALCAERRSSRDIAQQLKRRRVPTAQAGRVVYPEMARRLTIVLGLSRRARHGSRAGLGADEYRPMELARRLGVRPRCGPRWVRSGYVHARRDADAHHVIWADADELERLRGLSTQCALPRTRENSARLAELQKPKPRPT